MCDLEEGDPSMVDQLLGIGGLIRNLLWSERHPYLGIEYQNGLTYLLQGFASCFQQPKF